MNVNTGRSAIALTLFVVLAVGWAFSALADEKTQTDSSILSGTVTSEVTIEGFAETAAPTLVVSRSVVETYIPVAFDASAFEVQSPSTAAYSWDLTGDGEADAVSGVPLFFHTYQESGTYSVTVRITDAVGTDIASDPVDVLVTNRAPEAAFAVDGESVSDLAPVQFQDRSRDIDGLIVSWAWDFGDGTTSSEASPAHAYATPGVFVVRLVVADESGASSEPLTRSLSVANTPPIASLVAPSSALVGQSVVFSDDSFDPSLGGRIVQVALDFGDGGYTAGFPRADGLYRHTYATAGDYVVHLYVIDAHGGLTVVRKTIQVG